MSHYDLTNHIREFPLGMRDWYKLLELAEAYGWKPKGTTFHKALNPVAAQWKNWSGNYHSFDNPLVDEDDAKNMAKAIKKALKDLSEERVKKNLDDMTLTEVWSGKEFKKFLKDFIKFCNEGCFIIR